MVDLTDPERARFPFLLLVAIRGRESGFPVDVESGYLPRHLLDATWAGEKQL